MFNPFNYLAIATGQPAISPPLHWSDEGLPIGSLSAARCGEEATLLRLAGQLEQAQPWAARPAAALRRLRARRRRRAQLLRVP